MKHLKQGRKLHRVRKQRKALLGSLAKALIKSEKIITTKAKAKELSRFIEPLMTKAKNDSLASRRMLLEKFSGDTSIVNSLYKIVSERFKERKGGYTRITNLLYRKMDGAKMAQIELLS